MMNNIYGQQVTGFEFNSACQAQKCFDETYAAQAALDYVKSESEDALVSTDIKELLAKISPSAKKKIKKTVEDCFSIESQTADDETTADDKKSDDKKKKKKSPKLVVNNEDRNVLTPHTLISYIANIDLEKCADSIFGQIFADYLGARVHAIDVPNNVYGKKTYVAMELQFSLRPTDTASDKIKNVCLIDDELSFKKATGVTPDVANVMNAFTAQRVIGNQKSNVKLNDETRSILADFINKNVFITNNDGEMVPDWRNLETSFTNVGQPTGNNNFTNGEIVVSAKIDACIFISKIFKLLDIDTSKFSISLNYFAPCDPTAFAVSGNYYWNVWRGADKLPFLIEVRETDVKEATRIARLTQTGRYGAPVGFMYNRTM